MTDIVERLRSIADTKTGAPLPPEIQSPNGWGEPLSRILREAAAEIEHLRSVAGAVSRVPSHRDLRGSIDIGKMMGPPPDGVDAHIGSSVTVHLSQAECLEADAQGIAWIDYARRKHEIGGEVGNGNE